METRSKRAAANIVSQSKPVQSIVIMDEIVVKEDPMTAQGGSDDITEDFELEFDSESDLAEELQDLEDDEAFCSFVESCTMNIILGETEDESDCDFIPPSGMVETKTTTTINEEDGVDTPVDEDYDTEESSGSEYEELQDESDLKVPLSMLKEKEGRYPFMWRTHYQLSNLESSSYKSEEDLSFEPNEEDIEEESDSSSDEEELDEQEIAEEAEALKEKEDVDEINDLAKNLSSVDINEPEVTDKTAKDETPLGRVFSEIDDSEYKSEDDQDFEPPTEKMLNSEDSSSSTDSEEVDDSNSDNE